MLQNLKSKTQKYVNIASIVTTIYLATVPGNAQDSIDDDLVKIVEYVKSKGWSNGPLYEKFEFIDNKHYRIVYRDNPPSGLDNSNIGPEDMITVQSGSIEMLPFFRVRLDLKNLQQKQEFLDLVYAIADAIPGN